MKAGAIETASSVNGQIMPPVMGAAAFLMVEYVGIPYTEIIKHAFLPATISYIALFYIVHLEALKLGMQPMAQARKRTPQQKLVAWGLRHLGHHRRVLCDLLHRRRGEVHVRRSRAGCSRCCSRRSMSTRCTSRRSAPTCRPTSTNNPVLPETWPTVKAGCIS